MAKTRSIGECDGELMLEEIIEPADRIRAHAAAVGGDAHFVHHFDALLAQSTPMRVPLDKIGEMLLEDV